MYWLQLLTRRRQRWRSSFDENNIEDPHLDGGLGSDTNTDRVVSVGVVGGLVMDIVWIIKAVAIRRSQMLHCW